MTMRNCHSPFLLTQELRDNQRNLRSGRRFKIDQKKYCVQQINYGKPCPCHKMSWMLETKINSKDDQIRERKVYVVDIKQNEQSVQGSRGAAEHL